MNFLNIQSRWFIQKIKPCILTSATIQLRTPGNHLRKRIQRPPGQQFIPESSLAHPFFQGRHDTVIHIHGLEIRNRRIADVMSQRTHSRNIRELNRRQPFQRTDSLNTGH